MQAPLHASRLFSIHLVAAALGGLGLLALGLGTIPVHGQTPTTTIENGNADTRFQLNYDGGLYVPGIYNPTTPADSIPATGAGTRMMWYPAKAAFRAGRVGDNKDGTQWDAAKVGNYSAAFGVDTKASGYAATAMGEETTASGIDATAMGEETTASGGDATAMGYQTTASGRAATAMGQQTTASGDRATAMGYLTKAKKARATAMGRGTIAEARDATAMSYQTTASGPASTAMGDNTTASGDRATAMGDNTTASGIDATAMGDNTTAATGQSLSIGSYNSANSGNSADGTLFVVGNGSSGSRNDALVLDDQGNLDISGSLSQNSDRRLKTGIEPLSEGTLQKLGKVRPVRYEFKDQKTHPSGSQIGLIAQDVRREFPSLVSENSGGYLSLAYPKLTAVLLKGLQEQQAQIRTLKSENDRFRAQNDELERRVGQIENVKKRLAAVEAGQAPSAVAGLTGSAAGTVLAFLLGGFLGAGLLGIGLLGTGFLAVRS